MYKMNVSNFSTFDLVLTRPLVLASIFNKNVNLISNVFPRSDYLLLYLTGITKEWRRSR